jgi:hypothetical protein
MIERFQMTLNGILQRRLRETGPETYSRLERHPETYPD